MFKNLPEKTTLQTGYYFLTVSLAAKGKLNLDLNKLQSAAQW